MKYYYYPQAGIDPPFARKVQNILNDMDALAN